MESVQFSPSLRATMWKWHFQELEVAFLWKDAAQQSQIKEVSLRCWASCGNAFSRAIKIKEDLENG